MTPHDVAAAYFAANDRLDADAVAELYAEDGEMVVNGVSLRRGREVIRAHYRAWMAEYGPGDIVSSHGPLVVDGSRVAVEICCDIRGSRSLMSDFFEIRDGLITRLSCYVDTGGLDTSMASRTQPAAAGE